MRHCFTSASSLSSRLCLHHHQKKTSLLKFQQYNLFPSCKINRRISASRHLPNGSSSFSTLPNKNEDLVVTDLNEETGIATMFMNNPPVNSLSLEMCQAISNAIKEAESNNKIKCLIVTSTISSIFCAGLELKELYQPNPIRLRNFWSSFQQLYIDLYGSHLACIAAINGHAIAGGCMVALSCDYRIMKHDSNNNNSNNNNTNKKKNKMMMIGLNESQLGIVAPPWLVEQYRNTIGHRNAELGLSLGILYNPLNAKEIGLIDKIYAIEEDNNNNTTTTTSDHNDTFIEYAKEHAMKQWMSIPSQGRIGSKKALRQRQIDHLLATREEDTDEFCSFVVTDDVQQNLGKYLEGLAKKKK